MAVHQHRKNELLREVIVLGTSENTGKVSTTQEWVTLLSWLDPADSKNKEDKPPSLLIKNLIEKLIQDTENPQLLEKLREFYLWQCRVYFYQQYGKLSTFNDLKRIEKHILFPLRYVPIFDTMELVFKEMKSFGAFVFKRNEQFMKKLTVKLRDLLMEDDFDMAKIIVTWFEECEVSTTDLVLGTMLEKIDKYSTEHFTAQWEHRYLIIETFNSFIAQYWSNLSELLLCEQDNHSITTTIYSYFRKRFILIRTQEIFDICISSPQQVKPTLLEMRRELTKVNDFNTVVVELLSKFNKRVINPSVTTLDALILYVRTIKTFCILDPSGRYLQTMSSYIKPYFRQRKDMVHYLLYALLGLENDEISDINKSKLDSKKIKMLTEELRDTEVMYCENEEDDMVDPLIGNMSRNNDTLIIEQVIRKYNQWVPDIPSALVTKTPQNDEKIDIFDFLLELFESKEYLVIEFKGILTKKLLNLRRYRLDDKWNKFLKLLRKRFVNKNGDAETEDDIGNINTIDIMLRDIEMSKDISHKLHATRGGTGKIMYPKIISSLYWTNNPIKHSEKFSGLEFDRNLNGIVDECSQLYSDIKVGQKLELQKEHSKVTLQLSFLDGRTVESHATIPQYFILTQFKNSKEGSNFPTSGLSLEELCEQTKLDSGTVAPLLQFWINQDVLYYTDGKYRTLEFLRWKENSKEPTIEMAPTESEFTSSSNTQSQREVTKASLFDRIFPYIKDILFNLGTLRSEKLHNLLKTAIPKELSYDLVTNRQLEDYLDSLVENGTLSSTSNSCYKLP
ncbi:anaphase promoting complex subunit 2 RNJ42_00702 [Nakaseomyces bracarensis]|uniref:anaphase promoting complex subunit 2 n=1 Tax=Nakaseomyces bracarensis TaxID=273131 RepID=UPI00387198D3